MKKLGILMAMIVIFALVGSVSASTAEQLQPAQSTFNEDMDINGNMDVSGVTYLHGGVHVGDPNTGGVTYFNGSILNESTAVTIADDLRVDGAIYRTEVGGDNEIKIADTIIPATTNAYDLGLLDKQWNNIYTSNVYVQDSLVVRGGVTVWNSLSTSDLYTDVIRKASPTEGSDIEMKATLGRFVIDNETRLQLEPTNRIWDCDSSHYGEMIFSTTSLNSGGANRLYVCDSSGWNALN